MKKYIGVDIYQNIVKIIYIYIIYVNFLHDCMLVANIQPIYTNYNININLYSRKCLFFGLPVKNLQKHLWGWQHLESFSGDNAASCQHHSLRKEEV